MAELLHKTCGVNFLNSQVFDALVYMLKYQRNKNQWFRSSLNCRELACFRAGFSLVLTKEPFNVLGSQNCKSISSQMPLTDAMPGLSTSTLSS